MARVSFAMCSRPWPLILCFPHLPNAKHLAHPHQCPVCSALLYNPVTLHCGHTCCQRCLALWVVSSAGQKKCPVGCGAQLHGWPHVSIVLKKQIEERWRDQYVPARCPQAYCYVWVNSGGAVERVGWGAEGRKCGDLARCFCGDCHSRQEVGDTPPHIQEEVVVDW